MNTTTLSANTGAMITIDNDNRLICNLPDDIVLAGGDQTINGSFTFTRPVRIADAVNGNEAVARAQFLSLMNFQQLSRAQDIWDPYEDYTHLTMQNPQTSLKHFLRSRDYFLWQPDGTAAYAPSRLTLSYNQYYMGYFNYNLPNIYCFPVTAAITERNNWKLGISYGLPPVATTPASFDEYPFLSEWAEYANGPFKFWFDIMLPNTLGRPVQLRMMCSERGSTEVTLTERALTFPKPIQPKAIILAQSTKGTDAAIYLLNNKDDLYLLHEFGGWSFYQALRVYLDAYSHKPVAGLAYGTTTRICAPITAKNDEVVAYMRSIAVKAF